MVKSTKKRLATTTARTETVVPAAKSSAVATRTVSGKKKVTKKTTTTSTKTKKATKVVKSTKATKTTTSTRARGAADESVKKTVAKKTIQKTEVAAKAKRGRKPTPLPGFDTVQLLNEMQARKASVKEFQTFLTAYDAYGYTRLMHAAMQGDLAAMKELLAVAGKVFTGKQLCEEFLQQQDKLRALTAIHMAVARGQSAAVTLLFDAAHSASGSDLALLYATIAPHDGRYNWTPLMVAVNKSFYPMIAQLLAAYAKLLPHTYVQNILQTRDMRGEVAASYTTRDDVQKLLQTYSHAKA